GDALDRGLFVDLLPHPYPVELLPFFMEFGPLASSNMNGRLRLRAMGMVDGQETALGTLTMVESTQGLTLTPDFSDRGAETAQVEFYLNGRLIAALQNMTGSVLTVPSGAYPSSVGKLGGRYGPILDCYLGRWPEEVLMVPNAPGIPPVM